MARPLQVHDRGGSKSVTLKRDRPAGRKRNVPEVSAPSGPGGVVRAAVMWGAQLGHASTSANAAQASRAGIGTSKDLSTRTVAT
jgi:hypothetical protein